MQLRFSRTEFFDVFGAYNCEPAALALWVVSLGLILAAVRASEPPHRALSALLAVHWSWSALPYHAAFFTRINPAAWSFAGLFLIQVAVFVWFGVVRGRLRFSTGLSVRHVLAGALVAYALAYPLINLAQGLAFPRVPTFGVPCPATMLAVWSLADGEPAVLEGRNHSGTLVSDRRGRALLFGVRADLVLFIGPRSWSCSWR